MPESAGSTSSETEMVSTVVAADLRTAFEGMFGTTEYFEKVPASCTAAKSLPMRAKLIAL